MTHLHRRASALSALSACSTPGPRGSNNGTDPWYAAPEMGPEQKKEVAVRTAATPALAGRLWPLQLETGAAKVVSGVAVRYLFSSYARNAHGG